MNMGPKLESFKKFNPNPKPKATLVTVANWDQV
jgi:hypothetical protein